MGDRFEKAVHKNEYRIDRVPPIPGKQAGGYINIQISFDNFQRFLNEVGKINTNLPIKCTIYDEGLITSRYDLSLRYNFLERLNGIRFADIRFNLSDATLPVYNTFMTELGWRHKDATSLKMTIDRNPLAVKDLRLLDAKGLLLLKEENLVLQEDHVLANLTGKVKPTNLSDAQKLKSAIKRFGETLDRCYYSSFLTDYDKAYLAYHYLFDRDQLGITFATEQTYRDINGVQRLKSSKDQWESKPYGTYAHRRGVCEGQARLMSILLNNREIKVPSTPINGHIPSGEIHTWTGFVIDDKLYQCCTTMRGIFSDLDRAGYTPTPDEVYPKVFKHASLTKPEIDKIAAHVKQLKR